MNRDRNKAATRATLYRLTKIYGMIRTSKERITTIQLAAEFECSRKTIDRDLDFLRDSMGLPIAWDQSDRTWKIEPDQRLNWWLLAAEGKQ